MVNPIPADYPRVCGLLAGTAVRPRKFTRARNLGRAYLANLLHARKLAGIRPPKSRCNKALCPGSTDSPRTRPRRAGGSRAG